MLPLLLIWHYMIHTRMNTVLTTPALSLFSPQAYLYSNAGRIVVKALMGGYSSGVVLSVQSFDKLHNAKEAPSVVKIDKCEVA